MNKIKKLFKEALLLERSIPGVVTALFVLAIIAMNLLANKSISIPFELMALDCGVIFSWLVFLLMDMVTRRFGPKAATMLSVIALIINLFMALMLFIGSVIPGLWGESFVDVGGDLINTALDNTFKGTWYVLLGSSVAFICSSIVNNELNWLVGKWFSKKENVNFGIYAVRSYLSTFIGQFVDNLIFALIVSHNFFGWSMTQCIVCALTGAVIELLCEVIFSPIGYRISKRWEKNNVGKEYIDYIKAQGGRV